MTAAAPAVPKNVAEALARVMEDLPAIGKDQSAAPQQGGYSYRGIEAITAQTQRLFAKYGVVFVPRVTGVEVRDIVVNGKPWTDTTLTVAYTILHGPSNTSTEAVVMGVGRDNSDKGANKAMTQAFKYVLTQVLCISDAKDDADNASHEADAGTVRRTQVTTPETPQTPPGKPTKPMMDLIVDSLKKLGIPKETTQRYLADLIGIEPKSAGKLTFEEGRLLVEALAKELKEAKL